MSSFIDTQASPQPIFTTRNIANLMIVVGLLALSAALFKGVADFNIFNSPFDVVDSLEDGGKGFLPMVVDADPQIGLGAAPILSPEEIVAQVPEDELIEVMEALRSSQSGALGPGEADAFIPDRIVIPSIDLDVSIFMADYKEIPFWGKIYKQWIAPNSKAVGWHYDSATLGGPGNTVLNGHHNIYGEVFRYLSEVKPGSIIYLYSGDKVFTYIVGLVDIIPERYQSVDERLDNARWALPSEDERITLISCWPYESNTHRVIVVAVPIVLDG